MNTLHQFAPAFRQARPYSNICAQLFDLSKLKALHTLKLRQHRQLRHASTFAQQHRCHVHQQLVDTAGLRDRDSEASGATERAGITRALAAAAAADLVVEVVEVGEPVATPAGLVVWSKADLWPGVVVPAGVIATSSRSGAGIVDLVGAVVAHLVPEAGEPGLLDGAVPFLPRHLELLDRLVGAEPAGESAAIRQ